MKYRLPVVSGSFYPATAHELNQVLDSLFGPDPLPDIYPKALIVPHAGYCYSGDIAAHAYACLLKSAAKIKRVLLLGPSHQVALRGCAIASHDAFTTPLGNIPLDRQGCQHLLDLGFVSELDQAHQWEHSLEVQLPFLQRSLENFELIPIVVGWCQPQLISDLLKVYADRDDTLFIISSDLSHYHSYSQAQSLDTRSIDKILALVPCLQPDDACGCYGINGLLQFCREHHWQITLVKQGNSGDYCENKDKVVGYASFALY